MVRRLILRQAPRRPSLLNAGRRLWLKSTHPGRNHVKLGLALDVDRNGRWCFGVDFVAVETGFIHGQRRHVNLVRASTVVGRSTRRRCRPWRDPQDGFVLDDLQPKRVALIMDAPLV